MIDESEDWGPWIEHDFSGCPILVGQIFEMECQFCDGTTDGGVGVMSQDFSRSMVWVKQAAFKFFRYRIRKPRALRQLRDMVENLPAPERERADT